MQMQSCVDVTRWWTVGRASGRPLAVADPRQTPEPGGDVPAPADPALPSEGNRMELPTWNRSRRKRKGGQGQVEDAFQGGMRQAGKAAARRAPILTIAVVLVAALVGGIVWFRHDRHEHAAQATRLLSTAVAYQARGQVLDLNALMGDKPKRLRFPVAENDQALSNKVDDALVSLNTQAPASTPNHLAQLVRAGRAMQAGSFADARVAYGEVLEHTEPDHPLRFLAQEGLGLATEAEGDLEGALSAFELLTGEKSSFYRDVALWHQGRVLERLGRRDDAVLRYRQYIEEYPLSEPSTVREEVRKRLLELDPSAVPAESDKAAPPALPMEG